MGSKLLINAGQLGSTGRKVGRQLMGRGKGGEGKEGRGGEEVKVRDH